MTNTLSLIATAVVMWSRPASAADLTLAEPQSAVFGGSETTWKVQIGGAVPAGTRLVWEHTANQRVLSRDEVVVESDDVGTRFGRVIVRIPATKPGVILQTDLTIAAISGENSAGALSQSVWVFPEDPFVNRQAWLQSQKLRLFDPDGETSECLRQAGIPLRKTAGPNEIAKLGTGRLIVAEGISLSRQRWLGAALLSAAAGGAQILWIAPRDGLLPFPPENGAESPRLESLTFRRDDVIRQLDKRLDDFAFRDSWSSWPRYRMASERGRVVWQATTDDSGWPWINVTYATGGRLILCGYPLISTWDRGPTSRYLFARILESFAGEADSRESESTTKSAAAN